MCRSSTINLGRFRADPDSASKDHKADVIPSCRALDSCLPGSASLVYEREWTRPCIHLYAII
jgi:hypothetical protein